MTGKPFLFTLFFVAPPVVAWSQSAENPQKPSTYIVKKGDCLWNISKRVWGDPQKWPLLFATNEAEIKNPNLIYPGQEFKIPTVITNEELRKAEELAQERAVPLPAGQIGAEGTALKTHKKHHITTAPNESSAAAPKSEPAAPSAASVANQPAPSSPNEAGTNVPAGGSSKIVLFAVALFALLGGVVLWLRKRNTGAYQQPRPLSAFPQTGAPPANRTTESPSNPPAPAPATPSAVPPSQGSQGPQNPPPQSPSPMPNPSVPPGTKAGGVTETTTSISMSQPPLPSKAEPSISPSSASPSVPAPATPPAPKPPENNSPDGTQPPPSNP